MTEVWEAGRLWEEKGKRVSSTCHVTQELFAALGRREKESFVPFMVPANPAGVPSGG